MSAPPWMPMYWGDYFSKTRHLTCEQHGAYLQLLGTMWLSGGSLKNTPQNLAKLTGCTPSRWAKISPAITAFFVVEGDTISHERLMFELKKAQEKSIKRAVLGASGGRAKSLKTKEAAVAIANDLLDTRARLQPQPDKREDTVVSSPRARAKKSSRMPVDWLPGEGDLAVAYELGFQGPQMDRELAMMRDFEFTRPRSDWGATYRNWFRKAKPDGQSTGQDARQLARHENYRNALAGFEDAVAARRE